MSLGTFCIVKNEARWLRPHISRIIPFIDQMSFFDGNSTDGSLEIIESFAKQYLGKIRLVKDRDPKDLKDDYVRIFNGCLHNLDTDLAWFLHPDMWVENPEHILAVRDSKAIALTVNLKSYAGEPDGKLYRINGRAQAWKSIYRLKNPDLGAHYWGHYGHDAEDVYFSAITGSEHNTFNHNFQYYPYPVQSSGLCVRHYSDVRPYERRYSRMVSCLVNQGHPKEAAAQLAAIHPRVTLKDGGEFGFVEEDYPKEFLEANKEAACL